MKRHRSDDDSTMPDERLRRRYSSHHEEGALPQPRRESAPDLSTSTPAATQDPDSASTLIPLQSAQRLSHDGLHHVRFSSEIERPLDFTRAVEDGRDAGNSHNTESPRDTLSGQHVKAPTLTLDTSRAIDSSVTGPQIVSAPVMSSQSFGRPGVVRRQSPVSPGTRNRGYSMRRTLLNRNVHEERGGQHGDVIELGEAGTSDRPSEAPSSHAAGKKSIEETSTATSVAVDELGVPTASGCKSVSPLGMSALPRYENLVRKTTGRKRFTRKFWYLYNRLRKTVLRITEIPPSKDGRHIDVDALRTGSLTDERTSKPYISNSIRSTRYNAWNFVPRQLVAQFSRLANAYFLCVAILQLIPGLSTTGTYTTIAPLMAFVTISIAKEGYDDLRRHRLDKEENNRDALVYRGGQAVRGTKVAQNTPETLVLGHEVWATVKWRDVRVGDIVRVARDGQVPADIVLLSSKGENSISYIETLALDGETNLKSKQPPPCLARTCDTLEKLEASNAHIVVEDPNLDLYNFEGRVTADGETAPLSNNEIVYRGSVLRNTPSAIGLVIYSGEECKIRMNAMRNPRIKAPALQAKVNKIIIAMVIFVIALSVFMTVAYKIWSSQVEPTAWYLSDASVPFFHSLVSFIIIFNTLIPLSLYVSLEIVKVFQRYLLNDIDMYDEDSDTPMEARTSTINEELGQVGYIFSDKTGTLTDNCMKFRKLSVAGTAWLHDSDLKLDAAKELEKSRRRQSRSKGKSPANPPRHSQTLQPPRNSTSDAGSSIMRLANTTEGLPSSGRKSSTRPTISRPELHTIEMIHYIQRRPFTIFARKARLFLLSIALCHTCLPEKKDDGSITYQAASPDELALVQAAQELGYMMIDRHSGTLTIKTFPRGNDAEAQLDKYEVLNVIEFSSKRKRMSVIVRFLDKRICIMTKGADSTIVKLLRLSALALQKSAEIERRAEAKKSVEVQQAIARKSDNLERSPLSPTGAWSRPSFGGFGRTSIGSPETAHRRQLDVWLRERERGVDTARAIDHAAYSPRPSGTSGRPSVGAVSAHSSLQTDDADFELVEEALVADEQAGIERCFQHVNDFATDGLRTLLYGYRFLSEAEYNTWRKVYLDATTSLVSRQEEIERAGDLIEQDLELAGATAIEDKLQRGVPEAIDKLRRAGIKLWMLTGDKRETAINIGHSCRLIKDYSTVTVLDMENPGLEHLLASTIMDLTRRASSSDAPVRVIAHSVAVIDGATLSHVTSSPTLAALFLDLSPLVDSLICCRASPSQKASLVRSIRHLKGPSRGAITLAIGDGANDIAMIQEAHVGIGITGREGLQAARTSDYSIAQFRFLVKLLLVHGRWNYVRTAKYILATFWKEALFYLTQACYQRYAGYTGTSFYESISLTTFNTLFTSLPVIILGIFEQDLRASTLLAVPELYASCGLAGAAFNWRRYLWWVFLAAAEAVTVFFVMLSVYGSDDGNGLLASLRGQSTVPASTATNSAYLATINAAAGGSDNVYPMAAMTFTAVVLTISLKLQLLEMHYISYPNLLSLVVSIGGWWLWMTLLALVYEYNNEYFVRDAFFDDFGPRLDWWAGLGLILVAVGVVEVGWRALRWVVGGADGGTGGWRWKLLSTRWFSLSFRVSGPSDTEIFQVLEKDPVVGRRFEDAARPYMPYGLAQDGEGTDEDGEEELAAEKEKVQAQREDEIAELLRRRGAGDGAERAGHDVNGESGVGMAFTAQEDTGDGAGRPQPARSASLGV